MELIMEMVPKALVEIIGSQRVLIENHLGLLDYEQEKVVIRTHFGEIQIRGNGLHLKYMHKDRLIVMGKIMAVYLETEDENE